MVIRQFVRWKGQVYECCYDCWTDSLVIIIVMLSLSIVELHHDFLEMFFSKKKLYEKSII